MEMEIGCAVKVMQIFLQLEVDHLQRTWLWCACRKFMFHANMLTLWDSFLAYDALTNPVLGTCTDTLIYAAGLTA
eukprot:535265-Ditylum_brightwellii.AAC.2